MMSGVKKAIMALAGVVTLLVPVMAHAAATHYLDCNNCHKPGVTYVKVGNTCIAGGCHSDSGTTIPFNGGLTGTVVGHFSDKDASNAMGSHPSPRSTASGDQTSHYWGGSSATQAAAGSVAPPTSFYKSSYNVSSNKVTCSMCHDPHGDGASTPKLVRGASVSTTADHACMQCHTTWYVASANALQTHPIVADYAATAAADNAAAAAASKPDVFKTTLVNAGAGDVRLVNGGVGCTSCHGAHFADSNSTTADDDVTVQVVGDGKLLRTDGALRTVTPFNDANSIAQAQLRSNLCQACHTYKMHGSTTDGGPQIGCLDCHSGHSYNGGIPNIYVLRRTATTFAPRYANAYTTNIDLMAGALLGGKYDAAYSKATYDVWSDRVVGVGGYCENCHGDVQSAPILAKASGHNPSSTESCTTCHHHDNTSWTHSFQPDVSAATCGDCHGFPPYLNARGDRDTGGTDGGYAYSASEGTPPPWDYSGDSGAFKNEAQTAHLTHAGGSATNPNLYFVGSVGTDNCNVCHGDNAGFNTQHRDATRGGASFRDVTFNAVASAGGALSPTYLGAAPWTCSNTYCHTNGGPRDNAGTKTYQTHVTPAWDQANGGGKNSLLASGTRCSSCHGNDATTMAVAQKNASQTHIKHLNKGYTCNVCHVATASSNSALQAGATRGNIGGKHVNGTTDVSFDTNYDLDPTASVRTLTGNPYVFANGTCSVYCHSDGKGNTADSTDWQLTSTGACGTCHLTTTLATGSHARHISATTGPQLSCDACHGTNAALGTHTGHIDGNVSYTATACTTCHAVDGGEEVPVWGNSITMHCKTCHTGASTSTINSRPAPAKALALTVGHGKASGTYSVSGNTAANQDCEVCHNTNQAGHFDGDSLDKLLVGGFDCLSCHNGTTAQAVKTHDNQDPAYTNQKRANFTKACLACHDPHGTGNIEMVAASKADFGGTVVFTARSGADSFNENDDPANLDDICATCHTTVTHDGRATSAVHKQGQDCTSCHSHNGAYGGFMPTGGNACNDCHANPPATGAHLKHTKVTTNDLAEDRTDCDKCHPGASSYTYAHSNSTVDLAAGITLVSGSNYSCATVACHASTTGEGDWTDATGLDCNSCHYGAAAPTGAGNTAAGTRALSTSHNKHFDKSKTCSACHDVSYSASITSIVGPLAHISDKSGANEGVQFTGMGQALADEAAVSRASMTFDDPNNTCSGGIGLGCHASGTPDWDVAIPANGCTQCHSNTTDATVNPVSGLHNNAAAPITSGVSHDDSFLYNAGANTADCTTCHTTSPSSAHMDGTLNASSPTIAIAAGVGFTDGTTPTCTTSGLAGCHLEGTVWARKWSNSAYNNDATRCANCHGTFASGWVAGVIHAEVGKETRGAAHNNIGTSTYPCVDCHTLGSGVYTFTDNTNDWAGTSHHGNNKLEMNSTTTGFTDAGARAGCATASCHGNDSNHDYLKSTVYTTANTKLQTLAGPAPSVSCSGCHGGGTIGTNANNYWPDSSNVRVENTAGAHVKHLTALASAKYGENLTQLLTDNGNGTADTKQKFLCGYCHVIGDGDHGLTANLPGDVTSMYSMWDLTKSTPDNGVWTVGNGTCATVNCHNNKTTPTAPTSYAWYSGSTGACIMCHTDVTAETAHTAHTGAQATFGMTIGCANCHQAATNWGTNTPPATGHFNGTFAVAGSTSFTYSGFTYPSVKGTCGTNTCHTSGRYASTVLQAPKTGSYTWGTAIAGCDACHETTSVLATGSHTAHLTTTSQAITCNSCHTAATVATHIDAAINFTGAAATYNTSTPEPMNDETFSTCGTNTCHNNGKNAAPYNNGLGSYTWNTAIGGVNSCTECHNNSALGEVHSNHTAGSATFGMNATCDQCHGTGAASGTHTGHVEGTIALQVSLNYSGTPTSVAVASNTFGTCNTTTCHSNGKGVAVVTPAWNRAPSSADDCTLCHAVGISLLTTGAHATHIAGTAVYGPYPGAGSTNCGECHLSPANNTSMGGYATHINGTISLTGGEVATGGMATDTVVTACNSCHGGLTAANAAGGAKKSWAAATRVACESCHGDYTLASISGKTAPSNAGTSFDLYGHGKVTNNPSLGGKACADCHDISAVGHLDGITGDDKRLKTVSGWDYNTLPSSYCGVCHTVGGSHYVHYDNTQTAGGTSDNGIYCITCHNPHGQNGNQEDMVRNLIAGRTVSGFTSNTSRGSYWNASNQGVCQVCHDPTEVTHFNRTTQEDGTHNAGQICTDCHKHSDDPAFQASGGGCNGCHGYPPLQNNGWIGTGAGKYQFGKLEDYQGGGRAHMVAAHISPTDPNLVPTNPIAQAWIPCAPCHDMNDHNMGLGIGNLGTQRDLSANWATVDNRYPRVRVSTSYNKSGTATYAMGTRDTTTGMGKCSSTTCHFGESPKWDCKPTDQNNDPF